MDGREQLGMLEGPRGFTPFEDMLAGQGLSPLTATSLAILQLSITRRCNMACAHCHVNAGPERREMMSRETLRACLDIAAIDGVTTVDITGGSPEMHPDLEWLLGEASRLRKRIIVRSNLAILLDDAYRRFIDVYAKYGIEVVGSLPDYRRERAEKMRGRHSFEHSVEALRLLNERGYGRDGSGLVLDLMHNPPGAFLPAAQKTLEREYKRQLEREFDVHFNALFCLTNGPIGRYLDYLLRTDNLEDYMGELIGAYNPAAAGNVMCRTTLSVGWDGTLYDCDFNQMLGLSVNHGAPCHIDSFDFSSLSTRRIVTANHCYCCTAGAGSSCQGAVA
jgi:radical SAM/Cys-rich protein